MPLKTGRKNCNNQWLAAKVSSYWQIHCALLATKSWRPYCRIASSASNILFNSPKEALIFWNTLNWQYHTLHVFHVLSKKQYIWIFYCRASVAFNSNWYARTINVSCLQWLIVNDVGHLKSENIWPDVVINEERRGL
jgi:hypothetical protein